MIRLMNESSSSEDKIRTDIDNIVKNGGDAYDAMDYLESNGFTEGISTTMKHPDGSVEITTFYNDKNGNMYVAIDHTPLYKGNEVIKVWFGYNESIKRSKNNKRSIKEGLDSSSYEDLKYEVYRAAERAFNSFVTNNEMNVSDDEITSIMKEVTSKLLESVVEI